MALDLPVYHVAHDIWSTPHQEFISLQYPGSMLPSLATDALGSSKEVMVSSVCNGGRAGRGQPTSLYPTGQVPSALSCLYLRHVLG